MKANQKRKQSSNKSPIIHRQNLNLHPFYYQQEPVSSQHVQSTRCISETHSKRLSTQSQRKSSNFNSATSNKTNFIVNKSMYANEARTADQSSFQVLSMSPSSRNVIEELSSSTLQKKCNIVNENFHNLNNQCSQANLETNYDDSCETAGENYDDEDQEFNQIAAIFHQVNMVQKTFRILKSLWVQGKQHKIRSQLPFQQPKVQNNVTSYQTFNNNRSDTSSSQTHGLNRNPTQSSNPNLRQPDPLYSGLINLEAIEESLSQFESISKSSMSSLLKRRNKSPLRGIENLTQSLSGRKIDFVKDSKTSLLQISPEKLLKWDNQNQQPQISLQPSQSYTMIQTPNLLSEKSYVSFCKQSSTNQQSTMRINQNSSHETSIMQVYGCNDSSAFGRKRSSINSIDRIKTSILEINLILAINKINSFIDKINQRNKIQGFFELICVYKESKMEEKLEENHIITRSIANDSIIQLQNIDTLNKQNLALMQRQREIGSKLLIKFIKERQALHAKHAIDKLKTLVEITRQRNAKLTQVIKNYNSQILRTLQSFYLRKQKLLSIQAFFQFKSLRNEKEKESSAVKTLKHVLQVLVIKRILRAFQIWKNKNHCQKVQEMCALQATLSYQKINTKRVVIQKWMQKYNQRKLLRSKFQITQRKMMLNLQRYFLKYRQQVVLQRYTQQKKWQTFNKQILDILKKTKKQRILSFFSQWKYQSMKQQNVQNSHHSQLTQLKNLQNLNQKFLTKVKCNFFNQWRSQVLCQELKKVKSQFKTMQDSLFQQVKELQEALGTQISDKVEYIHDYILELTQSKLYLSRIESALALRFSFNKFKLNHITDNEISKFIEEISSHDQSQMIEGSLSVKKDIFGERNAKLLYRLIKKNKIRNSQLNSNENSQIIGKNSQGCQDLIPLDTLALRAFNELKSMCPQYSEFLGWFISQIEIEDLKYFSKLSIEQAIGFIAQIKMRISDSQMIRQPVFIQEEIKIFENDSVPQQPLEQEKLNVKKEEKQKAKSKKKKIPSGLSSGMTSIRADQQKNKIKQGSPFLKKFSLASCHSNASSTSDLLNKKLIKALQNSSQKKKKVKQSSDDKKIKQQTAEITKLTQKVEEIQQQMTSLKQTQVIQGPPTIIKIRESSLESQQQRICGNSSINMPLQSASYFNSNWKSKQSGPQIFEDYDQIRRNLLLSARQQQFEKSQASYMNTSNGIKLGSSIERNKCCDHSRTRCTSKYCLICKD